MSVRRRTEIDRLQAIQRHEEEPLEHEPRDTCGNRHPDRDDDPTPGLSCVDPAPAEIQERQERDGNVDAAILTNGSHESEAQPSKARATSHDCSQKNADETRRSRFEVWVTDRPKREATQRKRQRSENRVREPAKAACRFETCCERVHGKSNREIDQRLDKREPLDAADRQEIAEG